MIDDLPYNERTYLLAAAEAAGDGESFERNVIPEGMSREEADDAMFSLKNKGFFFSINSLGVLFSHDGHAMARQYLKYFANAKNAKPVEESVKSTIPPPGTQRHELWLLTVLKESIKAVPVNKYALGVVGIVAAVAMVRVLIKDWRIAFFGTILMLAVMLMLIVLGWVKQHGSKEAKPMVMFLLWFVIVVFCITLFMLFTSFFFGWPAHAVRMCGR